MSWTSLSFALFMFALVFYNSSLISFKFNAFLKFASANKDCPILASKCKYISYFRGINSKTRRFEFNSSAKDFKCCWSICIVFKYFKFIFACSSCYNEIRGRFWEFGCINKACFYIFTRSGFPFNVLNQLSLWITEQLNDFFISVTASHNHVVINI